MSDEKQIITLTGATYLTAIPVGWDWRLMPNAMIVACHPDYAPRIFDPKTGAWSDVAFPTHFARRPVGYLDGSS
jgi:hypothetical protein